MKTPDRALTTWSRRQVLLASAITLAVSTFGLTRTPWLPLAQAAEDAPEYRNFLVLSRYLSAKTTLDETLGRTIFAALKAQDPAFGAGIGELSRLLQAETLEPRALQARLDSAYPTLAPWPRLILRAWYLGLVGNGVTARAVAYESTLMYPPVADVMVMPSYSRGVPGYWAEPPRPART